MRSFFLSLFSFVYSSSFFIFYSYTQASPISIYQKFNAHFPQCRDWYLLQLSWLWSEEKDLKCFCTQHTVHKLCNIFLLLKCQSYLTLEVVLFWYCTWHCISIFFKVLFQSKIFQYCDNTTIFLFDNKEKCLACNSLFWGGLPINDGTEQCKPD